MSFADFLAEDGLAGAEPRVLTMDHHGFEMSVVERIGLDDRTAAERVGTRRGGGSPLPGLRRPGR